MNIAEAVERFTSWETREDLPFVITGIGHTDDDEADDPWVVDKWPQGAAAALAGTTRLSAASNDDDLREALLAFRADNHARSKSELAIVARINGDTQLATWVQSQSEASGLLSGCRRLAWMNAHHRKVRPVIGEYFGGLHIGSANSRRVIRITPAIARDFLDLDSEFPGTTLPTTDRVAEFMDRITADQWTARDPQLSRTPRLSPRHDADGAIYGEFQLSHVGAEKMQAIINTGATLDVEVRFHGRELAFDAIAWLPAATVQESVLT